MVDYGEYSTNAIILTDSRCDENEFGLGTVSCIHIPVIILVLVENLTMFLSL
jgi:hypothetical protein